MKNVNRTKQIALATQDAYSRSRYTDTAWRGIILALLDAGATEAQVRWVLESKHMRWAADHANRDHSVTSADFLRYTTLPGVKGYAGLVAQAAKEVATGADLAGAVEGEQIADLIDIVAKAAKGINVVAEAKALIAEIKARAEGGR